MNRGQLIVVSGPSGVGKGTVLQQYLAGRQNVAYSVSATTRAPRPGEEDGVHYFFLSKEQFEQTAQSGGMLEYACYNGNYYGTPKAAVERERQQGNDVILEIEVQGALLTGNKPYAGLESEQLSKVEMQLTPPDVRFELEAEEVEQLTPILRQLTKKVQHRCYRQAAHLADVHAANQHRQTFLL